MSKLIIGTDFSGLGSPEEALKRLNVDHELAFACEKDQHAKASYLANHSPGIFYEDITTRDNNLTPYSDIYTFGFPCQAFSLAGNRKGFEDTRGTLFFNALDYINKKQPRVFIAENVKGLLSHDKVKGSKSRYGRTFGVIRDALAITINGQHNLYKYEDCINYYVHFQILNTKEYGIPQNRERIFIIGFRDEEDSIRFKFPKKIPLQLKLKDLLEKNVSEKYYLSETALKRLLRQENYSNPQINPQITGTINTKNNSGQLSMDNGTTLITEDEPKNQVIIYNDNGKIRDIGDISMSLDANYNKGMDNHGQRSMILEQDEDFEVKVAHRSRTEEAKEIRKENRKKGADTNPFAKKEVSFKETEIMNTITSSLTDDNIILIEHRGHIDKGAKVITDGIVPTLRAESHGHETKVIVDDSILFVKENTQKGYTEAKPGDSINISNPNSKTRRGRVGDQIANTLDTACNQAVYSLFDKDVKEEDMLYNLIGKRIRRLIPKECFRLMGYSDDFFEKCSLVNSDTQLYKQAGNSIVVDTILHLLIQILKALNIPYNYAGR